MTLNKGRNDFPLWLLIIILFFGAIGVVTLWAALYAFITY